MLDVSKLSTNLFIGGKWVNSERGTPIAVFNPSTEERITTVADASEADATRAVDAAAEAALGWATTPARERAEILRRCFEVITRDTDRLAELISLENGKSLRDARSEVAYGAEFFRWFAEEAVRPFGDIGIAPSGANRILVQYQPIGVSVLITPWNFPAAMATRKIAPALAAGCTCVLKPATETPLTAYAIAELLAEAGVPDGTVNVITSSTTAPVVNTMLADPRVRKLSFTGSTEVGRLLLRQAANQVIHSSMELGGNAPFVVCADANLDDAIEGAMIAKMRNGGEACTAANRFIVHESIAENFTTRLAERMSALRIGPGNAPDTDCGPLINETTVSKVKALVDEAVEKGARLVCGGERLNQPGFYYTPTVISNVPPEARIAREEIFGPVAPIYTFRDEADAIAHANDTEYGLVAYLYTSDLSRGLKLSEQLEAGMIALNRGLVSDPAAPFGGVKQSGLGREGAHHGMLEFMEAKYVATSW
ncbi:NAD-dependent succinate-semialdehyde dehydrogenase [Halomonas sp. MCCC 1A11036]|uniref:NAD-dependent succinate-semialdehyde dehydrogenase n=1 Tax=Billgrantia zhangzhouensis TaxID=2733481 RepID=A0ABS9ABQ4_9GAMM|nr:NAD-dependent succinate-semialdehyde dehydrogenase [Halomonas zhangzhouensis]MCE8018574.1 NAD-dependent succinate-semialdehyde dehydrogenase [Halomonas zhangzhouensis]